MSETRLPSNFPVHIPIRIFSDNQGYIADICTGCSDWYRFRIRLKPHDVEELNAELQQALEVLSTAIETENTCEDALFKLAEIGSFALKSIFVESNLRKTLSRILKLGAIIQFTSEDFFIPWELLYDGAWGRQIRVDHFWGMKYIVSRTMIRETNPSDLEPSVIQSSRPNIGVIFSNELKHVEEKEIPALLKLVKAQRISLFPLRPLNVQKRDQELKYIKRFLKEEKLEIIHFACHAYEEKPLSDSYLLVSDKFSIAIKDFRIHEFEIKWRPFVILNACLTGTFSPLHTSNWASLFRQCGARGVLATEFQVPDMFAAAFAEELYTYFLSGMPIGEALLVTRRSFWEKQKNPLGLAYALYSSPMIRIAKTEQEKK